MLEYECPKEDDLFSTIRRILDLANVKSLSKDIDDILSDDRIMNNGIIWFTEAKFNPSDSTCKTIERY